MRSTSRFAVVLLLVLSASARAETTDCTQITSLPFFITQPGVYCLKASLGGLGGISVQADDVTIDLNGHTLEPSSIGVAAYADQRNITVRNGTIRGGSRAIYFAGAGGSGHLVERIRAEGGGIFVAGQGGAVRNNTVIGTADANLGPVYGIEIAESTGMRVSDNV